MGKSLFSVIQNGPSGNSERGTYVSVGAAVLFFDEYKSTLLIAFIFSET
jgi:hypothetical protein